MLLVSTGLVSVNPYPSKINIPIPAKNSATSLDKGAPPDIKNLILPPKNWSQLYVVLKLGRKSAVTKRGNYLLSIKVVYELCGWLYKEEKWD